MEGLTELIPSLVKEDNSLLFSDFLYSCKEFKVFVKKSKESVSLINSLLNENDNRTYGLRLLQLFLNQSPRNVINEAIINWFHQCFKGVAQPSASIQSSYSYVILSDLLEASKEFSDVRKQISQLFIPKILDSVIDRLESSQNFVPILKCLYSCLLHYGNSCGNHKDKLEVLLVKLLTSEWNLKYDLAKCFHLLAQCGAPGVEMINFRQAWETQMLITTNSLQFVLDQLYFDVEEILGFFDNSVKENRKLDIPTVVDEYPLLKFHKMNKIFSSLSCVLETMLLDKFPTPKKVHPEALLGVISRTLAVTCKTLETKISVSNLALMAQLCDIHISAIKLLNSFLLFSRTNLLPFSSIIADLFIQIFNWTNVDDWPYCSERPYSAIRCAGYKCLLTWLSVAKSSNFTDTQVTVLVSAILNDIQCSKKIVKLNLKRKFGKSKSATMRDTFISSEKVSISNDTCYFALSCIPFLLNFPISVSDLKKLQKVITNLLFDIQRSLKCDDSIPSPYSKSNCRAQLYSALLALCISPHPKFPPPLNYANVLFHSAAYDIDIEVTNICSRATIMISHMLRPSAPSFDFCIDFDSEIIPPSQLSKNFTDISKSFPPAINSKQSVDTSRKAKSRNKIDTVHDSAVEIEKKSFLMDRSLENRTIDTVNAISDNNSSELICLDDSSHESIILISSHTDSDICAESNSSKLIFTNFTNLDKSCKVVTEQDEGSIGSSSMTGEVKNQKRSDVREISQRHSQKVDNEKMCEESHTPPRSTQSSETITIDDFEETSKEESFSDNATKSVSHSLKRDRSVRSPKKDGSPFKKTKESDVIVLSEEITTKKSPIGFTRRSKTPNDSDTKSVQQSKLSEYETKISEDISIIETSDSISQLEKTARNENNDECLLIQDEEGPQTKKSKHTLLANSSLIDQNDKNFSHSITSLDEVEDNEMLNSFVDSVPN